MKKVTVILVTIAMLVSFAVVATAENPPFTVNPGEGLFNYMRALEYAQLQVSEGLPEQALLENEFANKRMEALEQAAENAEGFGADVINALMAFLADSEGNLGSIIAQMAREKGDFDLEILVEVEEDIDARGHRLAEIIDEGSLPDAALAGVQKALDNMAAAAEKAVSAKELDGAGNPPGVELPEVELPEKAVPAPSVPVGRP